MKVLIAGGAGFLGSHLCERFQDHEVICLDNFSTGQNTLTGPLMVRHDVQLPFRVAVDWIFNLACPASPKHYQADPIQTTATNVLGMMNLLSLAVENKARILQASTSEVYGDPLVSPQIESYWGHVNPIGPRACYDEGKRCAETLCFDFNRKHGTEVRVVRIFNTYGPRMRADDGRVVSNFIVQALNGDDLTIYGDGSQTRSFCYVDDLIDGMLAVMNSNISGPVNLGNPQEFSMLELAELVLKMTGSKSKIVFCTLPTDDPKQRRPSISLAKTLGWYPKVSLEEGLSKTIAYFSGVKPLKAVSYSLSHLVH